MNMINDDLYLFQCEKLSALLSKSTCVLRHKSGRFSTCSNCAVGAAHAGLPPPTPKNNFVNVCSRCLAQASRMIGKRLCVSCYNREREFIKKCDRNGMLPHFSLYTIDYLVNSEKNTILIASLPEILAESARQCLIGIIVLVLPFITLQCDLFPLDHVDHDFIFRCRKKMSKRIHYGQIQSDLFFS